MRVISTLYECRQVRTILHNSSSEQQEDEGDNVDDKNNSEMLILLCTLTVLLIENRIVFVFGFGSILRAAAARPGCARGGMVGKIVGRDDKTQNSHLQNKRACKVIEV